MYQSEAPLTNLVSAPSTKAVMSPDNSYMTSNPSAPGNSSLHGLHFQSPTSTDYLQQLHNIPDAWLTPPQIPPVPLHHQNSWEPLPNPVYFQPPRQSPSYSKPRRNHLLTLGCKRSGSSSGKGGLRGLRDDAEENCGALANGSGSPPGDSGNIMEGVNGTGAPSMAATKRCRVCGDRAVNHNFGQLTCESCKAFFRRNAHKVKLQGPVSIAAVLIDNVATLMSGETWAHVIGLRNLMASTNSLLALGDDKPVSVVPVTYPAYLATSIFSPKDLTCTSKSGEHVVSPSTRRECPACRLKRCFLIGMRPDLIQVRKKDGTKPRWLDKYPTAAQVHEHHIARNDVPKMSRHQQNPNPGDIGSNRDSYAPAYPRYTEAPNQMMTGGRGFETYPTDLAYVIPQSTPASQHPQNSGQLYEENGQSISGMLAGDVMDPLSSPQYRASDCVVLTNPLGDESARLKASPWNQGLPVSNSGWSQAPSSVYKAGNSAPHFQTSEMFLLDGFPFYHQSQHHPPSPHYHQASLLANMQIHQERPGFGPTACLNAYVSSIHPGTADNRSGASSGSTTSPSVASSSALTNFGSGGPESMIQGNFEPDGLKSVVSEWTPLTEADSGSVYLHNISSLRNKMCMAMTTESRQPPLSPSEGDQWFHRLSLAWRYAWQDGLFSNPSNVRLHLELDSISSNEDEDWRLTLANLWSDLLLRRVADFTSTLFHFSHGEPFIDSQISPALLSWIFKNRLVNCVPVILARVLLRSTELNGATSSQSQSEITDDGGSSPRSPRDLKTTLLQANSVRKSNTLSVTFQVAPNHRVLICLSQLNAKLAENHSKTAYPMLQYLDAYISELNKFLTEQTLLLGAFMAVKLTEPPSQEELLQNSLSDEDLRQINGLNAKFLYLFGIAADHVAAMIVGAELGDSIQSRTKAMNDADCRRSKLPDFLGWGRHFDVHMKSFLYDVWNVNRQQPQVLISPGLAALFGDAGQLNKLLCATTPGEFNEIT
ncbi:hypothetical protein Aperf_G00000065051 [Anoplocephala perfoliata]